MSKIDRYDGNLKAFASEQQTNERTLFGQVTIANDLTSQVTTQFLRGWGIVGPSDQPSLQDFNAAMYTNGQLLAYLHQMGVAEYNAAQEYFIGSVTQTAGVLYMSLTNANIGNTPSSSPANWKAFTADQATEVALGLIKIATQTLTNAGVDDLTAVTPKKLAQASQLQAFTAFATTGTAAALVLTPVPAITAYAAPQRFRVKFSQNSTPTSTINVSGKGAKSLKQYDSAGAKVAAIYAADQLGDIEYDGTDFVLLDQLPVNTVQTRQSARGIPRLTASANGTSSSIPFSIGDVVVAGGSGPATVLAGLSLTLDTAATGSATVSGMVGGATVASTWYAVYAHYNPSSGVTILTGDANFSAPTAAPAAGFTQWCRISSFRTDATVNKYPLKYDQNGNDFDIWPLAGTNRPAVPIIASGSSGNVSTPTWTQVSISSIVPPTAKAIGLLLNATSQSVTMASPTGTHGDYTSTSNPPPMVVASTTAGSGNAGFGWSVISMMMTLQTLNVFRASNGTSFMACYGWKESL